jgi:hypothetical protein
MKEKISSETLREIVIAFEKQISTYKSQLKEIEEWINDVIEEEPLDIRPEDLHYEEQKKLQIYGGRLLSITSTVFTIFNMIQQYKDSVSANLLSSVIKLMDATISLVAKSMYIFKIDYFTITSGSSPPIEVSVKSLKR